MTAPLAHGDVVFTNLIFFTYTNPPYYGYNGGTPSGLGHSSALVLGNDGNLYGTTSMGGNNTYGNHAYGTSGHGTVFRVTPDGAFTSLHSFGSVNNGGGFGSELDGSHPAGNLLKGADGKFYGTTYYGGTVPGVTAGTIYQITPDGVLTTLYSFGHNFGYVTNYSNVYPTNSDGELPSVGLIQGSDGYFYGTCSEYGGDYGGTVFQFIPGFGVNTLYSFPHFNPAVSTIGDLPVTELTAGPDGNLYGTTYWGGTNNNGGTIFQITVAGNLTAWAPIKNVYIAPFLLGKDGNLYGVANVGYGQIFKMTTNGVITILHTFNLADGSGPNGLIQGSDGYFYGTTQGGGAGGAAGNGTVFRMTTNGIITTLHSFSGPDGVQPHSALVQGLDGSLYGTTDNGGPQWNPPNNGGYGTIFRIILPPTIQAIARTNSGVILTLGIVPGQTYQLQYTTNLAPANWLNLGSPTLATSNSVAISDITATDAQRFYRLQLVTTNFADPFAGLALVPAGTFTLGNYLFSNGVITNDPDITDASPTNVFLSAFYMDTNLVSFGQWQSVSNWAAANGYGFDGSSQGQGTNYPVVKVTWFDCVKWCNARSQQAGLTPVYYTDAGLTQVYTTGLVANPFVNWSANGYRLPTEAEWEKAARGGLSGHRFPWGDTISWNQANYVGDTNDYAYDLGPNGYNTNYFNGSVGAPQLYTSPVGSFPLNGFGLYDMAGNVNEWLWDWYAGPPYPVGSPYLGGTDPRGPATGPYHCVRGGQWDYYALVSRCAYRAATGASFQANLGFRCVRKP